MCLHVPKRSMRAEVHHHRPKASRTAYSLNLSRVTQNSTHPWCVTKFAWSGDRAKVLSLYGQGTGSLTVGGLCGFPNIVGNGHAQWRLFLLSFCAQRH